MSQIIEGMYEIQEQIGAGGGGIVYRGRHMRLDKDIVLKADKRKLSASRESLRREVDMLKDLSHTNIPQVYDFIQEGSTVYTVMDYIEGKSFDRILADGRRISQAEVVNWACQLLDALDYLHNRPPYGILHGDIKPANIMLRPDGNICLIDYNIALALGEEGAVKVGFSRGYASPEHYGADYIKSNRAAAVKRVTNVYADRQEENACARDASKGQGEEKAGSGLQAGREDAPGRPEMQNRAGAEERTDMPVPTEVTELMQEQTEIVNWEEGQAQAEKGNRTEGQAQTEIVNRMGEEDLTGTAEQAGAHKPARGKMTGMAGQRGGYAGHSPGRQDVEGGKLPFGRSGTESSAGSSTADGRKVIMLDERSDIYCLGATLYHILSGRRPAQDAREVIPLGPEICSPAVSGIIRKAMDPQPDRRYQSAKEMLVDFLELGRNDPRAVRHRHREAAAAVLLSVLFLSGGMSAFAGQSQLKQRESALALSEYSANALAEGDVSGAVEMALQAIPQKRGLFSAPMAAQAQKALTDALGVYDLSDGFKALDALQLPAAPFHITISPGGTRLAVVYAYEAVIYDLTDITGNNARSNNARSNNARGNNAKDSNARELVVLPVQESALSDAVFVGEDVLIYAGEYGVSAYDLAGKKEIWTAGTATSLALSGDGSRVAAVNRRDGYALIYRTSDGAEVGRCDFWGRHLSVPENDIFADAGDSILALNRDGSVLAASFQDGGLELFDLDAPEEGIILYETSGYTHFEGGFQGDYFAYGASEGGRSVFGLINVRDGVEVGGFDSPDRFLVQAGEKGIFLANGNLLVSFDPGTLEQKELAYTGNLDITGFSIAENYVLVSTEDNGALFYDSGANLISTEQCKEPCDFLALSGGLGVLANRNEPSLRLLRLEDHKDALLLSYDARYGHDEARISMDGQTAMLFNYRQFAIYDMAGRLITEEKLPDADSIYDQQFRKGEDGSWLEVTWYDGTVRRYSAGDGAVLSEEKGEPPRKDLYEEFYTEKYRIASSLHSAAEVYDRETGKLVSVLEKDSYLTYVTQAGEYLVTEYVSAAGERYGLLLDRELQTLAYLPGLCDIMDGELVFDYGSGNLRKCPLYSIGELIDMGEAYLEGGDAGF